MKIGDKVVMVKGTCPKSTFRRGVVVEIGELYTVRIKRDYYRGHESTWWNRDEWKVVRPPKSSIHLPDWPFSLPED